MRHEQLKNTSKGFDIRVVRPASREDLALLKDKRPKESGIAVFRDAHHNLARFIAAGLTVVEAAPRAGYSYNRAVILHGDPAFKDLVAKYREKVTEKWLENIDEYQTLAIGNMLKAERQINEKLDRADEQEELLPTRELLAISRDAADRFGHGKKSTTVNVNVDFAAKLEAGIARSRTVRTIQSVAGSTSSDAQPLPQVTVQESGSLIPASASEPTPSIDVPFRRRA